MSTRFVQYEVLSDGDSRKVKRLRSSGRRLSYQRHALRSGHGSSSLVTHPVALDGVEHIVAMGEAIDVRGASHSGKGGRGSGSSRSGTSSIEADADPETAAPSTRRSRRSNGSTTSR